MIYTIRSGNGWVDHRAYYMYVAYEIHTTTHSMMVSFRVAFMHEEL